MTHIIEGPRNSQSRTSTYWRDSLRGIYIDAGTCGWTSSAQVPGDYITHINGFTVYRSWLCPLTITSTGKQEYKGDNMLKELVNDTKGLIKEHRQVIFWMAVITLLDHFVLGGALRARIKGVAESLLGKVERTLTKE